MTDPAIQLTQGPHDLAPPTVEPAAASPPDEPVALARAALEGGDRAAFEAFYDIYLPRITRWTRTLTRRGDDFALDVAQNVFIRLIKRPPRVASAPQLDHYIRRCIRNCAIDLVRTELAQQNRDAAHARSEAMPQTAANNTRSDNADTGPAIDPAALLAQLRGLPADDIALLRARFEHGATLDQAGAAAGLSGDAAHGRLRRILARLRSALTGGGDA